MPNVMCLRPRAPAALAVVIFTWFAGSSPGGVGPGDGGQTPAAGEPAVEMLFLLDSSQSIARADPDAAHQALIEALAGCWWAYPGDRIAVASFSGWRETKARSANRGTVLMPPAGLPLRLPERRALVSGVRSALLALTQRGTGTDPNAAVEVALADVERARPAEGGGAGDPPAGGETRVLAVLVTDGDVNVVEGNYARQEYIDAAQESFGAVDPETLNRAARDVFLTTTLPALRERGVEVALLVLGDGTAGPGSLVEKGEEALRDALSGAFFRARAGSLRDAFAGLAYDCPVRRTGRLLSQGAAEPTVPAGAHADVPFRALVGTRRTRAVVFGASPAFDVEVVVTDRPAEGGPPAVGRADSLGEGRPYRVLWLEPGEPDAKIVGRKLRITNRSDAPATFEVAFFSEVGLKLDVKWPADAAGNPIDEHLLGVPVRVGAAVTGPDGEVVSGGDALKELRLGFGLGAVDAAAGGQPFAGEMSLEGRADARVDLGLTTEGLAPGPALASVRLMAYPAGVAAGAAATFLYTSPDQTRELVLMRGALVSFGASEAFAGQEVTVKADLTAPVDSPPPEIAARILPAGAEEGAEPRAVTLALAQGGRHYEGSVAFDQTGRWRAVRSIERDPADPGAEALLLMPGDVPAVNVRAQEMRVLSAAPPNEELKVIEFPVRYAEATPLTPERNETTPVPVVVAIDGVAGDISASVTAFTPSPDLPSDVEKTAAEGMLSFSIERRDYPPAGGSPSQGPGRFPASLTARLDVVKDGRRIEVPLKQTWEPGTLELRAELPGADDEADGVMTRTLPVRLKFENFWERLLCKFWKYWVPVAAVLLLILLLLLRALLLARFKEHQLRVIQGQGAAGAGFYRLRTLSQVTGVAGGPKSRKAIGTPEVKRAVRFRIKGLRIFGRGRVDARPVGEGALLYVNGSEAARWTRLKHGDMVRVDDSSANSCRYWYFERMPTAEELEARAGDYFIVLEPDELVIEFD